MLPKISDAEWLVMKLIWKRSGATSNEIIEELSKESNWKGATIKSLLNRLLNKEAIGFEKRGKEYFYFPLVLENECIKEESKSFINKFFNGSINSMLVTFVKEQPLSDAEVLELRELLDNIEKQPNKR